MKKNYRKMVDNISMFALALVCALMIFGFFFLGFIYGNESVVPYIPFFIGIGPAVALVWFRAKHGFLEW